MVADKIFAGQTRIINDVRHVWSGRTWIKPGDCVNWNGYSGIVKRIGDRRLSVDLLIAGRVENRNIAAENLEVVGC